MAMTISSVVANLTTASQRKARPIRTQTPPRRLRSTSVLGDTIPQRILIEVVNVAANIHSRNTPYLLARIHFIDPNGDSFDNVAAYATGLAAQKLLPLLTPDAFVYVHAAITTKRGRPNVELLAPGQ